MPRYTTRPKARGWFDDEPMIPECRVDDHVPKDTGLIDAKGDKIFRQPRPIGFGRDGDW